jgi:GMP synthase (glutamine-hydrolysing)
MTGKTKKHANMAKPRQSVANHDAGAQYGKVIDRRVRQLEVYSQIFPLDTPYAQLKGFDAIILSGGPESVYTPGAPHPDPKLWQSNKPILGICYGMQLINQAFGGTVARTNIREDGPSVVTLLSESGIFKGLDSEQAALMSHGDSIKTMAADFTVLGRSGEIIAAMGNEDRQIYGLQFHPEVDLTIHGETMFRNFLFLIAKLQPNYSLEDREQAAIRHIHEIVGERDVLVFVSGGVDSTVLAHILAKTLTPDRIHAVHVDTGFMRAGESDSVARALAAVGIQTHIVRAGERFLQATTVINDKTTPPLSRTTDPEIKRRIIGDTFVRVMNDTLQELGLEPSRTVLAQGTLRPDLIESASELASGKAAVIKTHHNDTPLVRELRQRGRVVEPLRDLHKDEVRQLGEDLGLPAELVWRQPFPGPGLAIRLLCASEPYITDGFDEIQHNLRKFDSADIATHLLPVRTVGVQGDGRSYNYLCGLSGEPNWEKLMALAAEIPRQVHSVNRVVYIFGDKLQGPVRDITPTYPTASAISQLRTADKIVNDILIKYRLNRKLSQVPVVSFPAHFGQPGKHSIGIRAFITNDFMTGTPAIPGKDFPAAALQEMVTGIMDITGIARVAYDLTPKPPATTEWE